MRSSGHPGAARYEHPESTQAVLRLGSGPGTLWLTYRTFARLSAPLRLSWRQLYRQFGARTRPQAGDKNHRERNFRHEGPTRVEEDQARLAGAELRDSQRACLILHRPRSQAIPTAQQLKQA